MKGMLLLLLLLQSLLLDFIMAYNRGGGAGARGVGTSSFSITPRRTGPETQMAQMG